MLRDRAKRSGPCLELVDEEVVGAEARLVSKRAPERMKRQVEPPPEVVVGRVGETVRMAATHDAPRVPRVGSTAISNY